MNNQEILKEIWKFDENKNEYISVSDRNCFKNNCLKLSYFYRTHVMPLPYIGEVNNPEILILALNPSYDPIKDEEDTFEVDKTNYVNNLFNVNFFTNIENSKKLIGKHTFNWWKTGVFNNLELVNNNTKIGIFNLCGYHSKEYRKISSVYLNSNSYLPSQNITKVILNNLINSNETKLIIVIWGKNAWQEYLGYNLNLTNLVVLNEYNHTNSSIYSYCMNEIENDKIKKLEEYFKIVKK